MQESLIVKELKTRRLFGKAFLPSALYSTPHEISSWHRTGITFAIKQGITGLIRLHIVPQKYPRSQHSRLVGNEHKAPLSTIHGAAKIYGRKKREVMRMTRLTQKYPSTTPPSRKRIIYRLHYCTSIQTSAPNQIPTSQTGTHPTTTMADTETAPPAPEYQPKQVVYCGGTFPDSSPIPSAATTTKPSARSKTEKANYLSPPC